MLRANLAVISDRHNPKRSLTLLLPLALTLACSFLSAGCNTNSLAESAAPSARPLAKGPAKVGKHISIQPDLPSASVGVSYDAVLSVNGGEAPYAFAVSQGALPPGLNLNPVTGGVSGKPAQAGSFAFTISVSDELGASGSHPYTVLVSPCLSCITVQISPINPSVMPGGSHQFSATVSNTGNTAVTWSASAGAISTGGLFTAPSGTGANPIMVTATSVAQNTAHASTTVTINGNSNPLTITTSSLPSATQNSPYSASLAATGGQLPYSWSIASGSLPAGLQLATSGTLSGSPTQTGTFAVTVQVTDAASQTAQQGLSLLISAAGGGNCGPPSYNCSRSDLNIVQVPQTPPSVGNLSGANTIVTDPDFSSRIVRITDANTNPEATFVNRTFVTAGSGSADDNLWNSDSTLLIVEDTGANSYPFSFDASTLQASRLYVSSFPTTSGFRLSTSGIWSRISPNVLYTYGKTTINKYDFTDRVNPPSPQPVYDFTSSSNCLPSGFTETWKTEGGVSGDDTVFGMAYSNAGDQGTGIYAVAYKVGSGCTLLNTQTGQVSGDWGTQGAINIPDRWTIHNVKLSKDGNWMIVAGTKCTSGNCSTGPYYWQIGTTNVSSCGDGGHCSGHWTEGYSHWVNCNNSPMANQVMRAFSQANTVIDLTSTFPAGIVAPLDQHQSWNNVDPADSLPFFTSTWSTITPFPAPWYNEILAVAADGSGKTWRFAHSFITARSQRFSTKYAIGTISQDGKFFIFSSDWMGALGSESGAPTCTVGTDCRGDVFVVELK